MVVYQINIEVTGDNLQPEDLLKEVLGDYKTAFIINPNDKEDTNRLNKFGSISFLHPKKIGFSDNLISYEEWVVNFIEENYVFFNKYKVDDISLFISIYYVDQCNIEVFDNKMLKVLVKYGVSIPMSIFKISKQVMKDMLVEEGFDEKSIWELNYSSG